MAGAPLRLAGSGGAQVVLGGAIGASETSTSETSTRRGDLRTWVRKTCTSAASDPAVSIRTGRVSLDMDCAIRIQLELTSAIQRQTRDAAAGRTNLAATVAELTHLASVKQHIDSLVTASRPPW